MSDDLSGDEFRRWYWTKAELVEIARELGLRTGGTKFLLVDRIAASLDGVELTEPARHRPTSRFDWSREDLTPDTPLTDSYRNTDNVRRFLQANTRHPFRFSIDFMAWTKANVGATLRDAAVFADELFEAKRDGRHVQAIPAGNQWNAYLRAFMADNPDRSAADARACWAAVRSRPSETGRHEYDPSDLSALD